MGVKVVAEIGCNHKGDLEIAKEMIMIAATVCKADVVKFQKRCPKELLSSEEFNRPHPNAIFSYGKTYGEHREALEFTKNQHEMLKKWCEDYHTDYSTSVWDLTSAREIIALEPKSIKIPSACNLNRPLLNILADEFKGQIHLSLGMTTQEEESRIIALFEKKGRIKDLVLYSCTSGYPVTFDDIGLLELTRIQKTFGGKIAAIGFSGHHLGIAADIAAMTLGATFIERHYTLDRTWKGTDHAASLEPDGLRRLVRDVRNVKKALKVKQHGILPVEQIQRDKLKTGQIEWTQ